MREWTDWECIRAVKGYRLGSCSREVSEGRLRMRLIIENLGNGENKGNTGHYVLQNNFMRGAPESLP